jgi:DpnD/PcfM-like protein
MKFKMSIREILARDYLVEAANQEEALRKGRLAYEEGRAGLDSDDFVDYEIEVSSKPVSLEEEGYLAEID